VQKERSAFFDAIYTENADPWGYLTSNYERGKYDATLAALPAAGYRSGLEIGCSIGVLSRRLAVRCEQMLAVDISSVAIERACSLGDQPANLTFMRCNVHASVGIRDEGGAALRVEALERLEQPQQTNVFKVFAGGERVVRDAEPPDNRAYQRYGRDDDGFSVGRRLIERKRDCETL
jgi:hypothetical protein